MGDSLLSPKRLWLTVSPDFNQHVCVVHIIRLCAESCLQVTQIVTRCFYVWFIHCSLSRQRKEMLAGYTAVNDDGDLGVRLGPRLF